MRIIKAYVTPYIYFTLKSSAESTVVWFDEDGDLEKDTRFKYMNYIDDSIYFI